MHLQAIVTKYHGPTNTQGSRISAKAAAGKVMVPYRHALSSTDNHAAAAKALAEKMGWGGHWVSGGMPNEDGDVFVCVATAGQTCKSLATSLGAEAITGLGEWRVGKGAIVTDWCRSEEAAWASYCHLASLPTIAPAFSTIQRGEA